MKKLNYFIIIAGLTGVLLATPYTNCHTPTRNYTRQTTEIQQDVTDVKTAKQLEDVIAKNEKVAVDISATWCGPCKGYDAVFKEVAKEYKGKIVFCKITLDKINNKEEKKISNKYNIRYIPKTILFKNGKEAYSQFGSMDKKTLTDLVETYLLEKNKN